MLDYYQIDVTLLYDDRTAVIFSSIIYKVPDLRFAPRRYNVR
jgi:hypothetical protein